MKKIKKVNGWRCWGYRVLACLTLTLTLISTAALISSCGSDGDDGPGGGNTPITSPNRVEGDKLIVKNPNALLPDGSKFVEMSDGYWAGGVFYGFYEGNTLEVKSVNSSEMKDDPKIYSEIEVEGKPSMKVDAVSDKAFENCKKLTGITLPDGVKVIYQCAFKGCINLKQVKMLSKKSMTMHKGVFGGCSALKDVYVSIDKPTNGENDWFGEDGKMGNATLHVPSGMIDTFRGLNGWKLFKIISDGKDAHMIPPYEEPVADWSKTLSDVEKIMKGRGLSRTGHVAQDEGTYPNASWKVTESYNGREPVLSYEYIGREKYGYKIENADVYLDPSKIDEATIREFLATNYVKGTDNDFSYCSKKENVRIFFFEETNKNGELVSYKIHYW